MGCFSLPAACRDIARARELTRGLRGVRIVIGGQSFVVSCLLFGMLVVCYETAARISSLDCSRARWISFEVSTVENCPPEDDYCFT